MSFSNLSSRLNYKGKRKKTLARLGTFALVLILLTLIPSLFIYQEVKTMRETGVKLQTAVKNQNLNDIQSEAKQLKGSLEKIRVPLLFLTWTSIIPLAGGYYQDIKHFNEAGIYGLIVVDKILSRLEPYQDELGLNGQPISGPDRISQAIKILEKVTPMLDEIKPELSKARKEVESIDANKYPENFKGQNIKQIILTTKNFIIGTNIAITDAKSAIEIAPSALGQPTPKDYLMLFQNDKEIRATGGFLTAFASITLNKGQLSTTVSDDIYRLDERLLATCRSKICPLTPPGPIVKYLPEVTGKPRSAWSMRDSNLSPDLPTSAKEFERMYELLGQGTPFDGIIYIDSQVVEELIEVTGEIEVFGTPYSSKIDARCNCPNVIYELESYAEIAAKGTQDRKAILGVLMQQILARAIGADVEKTPQILETIVRLANHKHIMFYMHDQISQEALAKLNWTGEIKDYSGDYIHINDSNFAGGKSNLYVEQMVTQDIQVQDGTIKKKLTIEYKNSQPFDTWLNGINRDYVRIYAPKGSKLISSKGSDDPVNTLEDLDKTVFDAFITVRPQNSRKLEFEYTSPYNPQEEYRILIQKQPGAKDFKYKIKLNGRQVADFMLDSDKEFKFSL